MPGRARGGYRRRIGDVTGGRIRAGKREGLSDAELATGEGS